MLLLQVATLTVPADNAPLSIDLLIVGGGGGGASRHGGGGGAGAVIYKTGYAGTHARDTPNHHRCRW